MKTIAEPNPITPTILADMKEIDRRCNYSDYIAVEEALLPCAHCGGQAIVSRNRDEDDSVQCDNCGIRTAAFTNVTDAANRWNHRTNHEASDMREILAILLHNYDEETGKIDVSPVATCPICTSGTVPNSLNRGLCALHRARKVLTREVSNV